MTPLVALLLLIAACSASNANTVLTTTSVPPVGGATPQEAAADWLEALEEGRHADMESLTADRQLAVLTAPEGRTPDEVLALLSRGLTDAIRESFWSGLARTFAAASGVGIGDLSVGMVEEFDEDGLRFAAVTLVVDGVRGAAEVVTMRTDGRWVVDPLATFAASFAEPIRRWLAEVEETGTGVQLRRRMEAMVPSLLAARARAEVAGLSTAQIDGLIAEIGGGP